MGKLLEEIESTLSRANFVTWFKNTSLSKQENGTATISVPNEFVRDWLNTKYRTMILGLLMNYSNGIRSVDFIISKLSNKGGDDGLNTNGFIVNELPLKNLYIDKKDNLNPRYTFDSFIVGSFNELAYAASQAIIKIQDTITILSLFMGQQV